MKKVIVQKEPMKTGKVGRPPKVVVKATMPVVEKKESNIVETGRVNKGKKEYKNLETQTTYFA